jgi:hypothetical protein
MDCLALTIVLVAEARYELPFSRTVPKTLGAVSVSLWNSLRSGLPLCLNHAVAHSCQIFDLPNGHEDRGSLMAL